MKNENYNFAEQGNQLEKLERPMKVVNVLDEMGVQSLQTVQEGELTPNNSIDVDDRALSKENCISVCFGRPHTGEFAPKELWNGMTEEGKKTLVFIDRGTSEIFRSDKISSVGTKMSRFIIDLNRGLTQKNTDYIAGALNWETGIDNGPIYQEGKKPTAEEVTDLAEAYFLPYYNKMMGVIGSLADRRKDKEERILVIDGHSFPVSEIVKEYFKEYGVDDPSELPMFILGDGDGKSCDPDIREAFVEALKKNFSELDESIQKQLKKNIKGDVVGLNFPFKGLHNINFYGGRENGINAFQLECNEEAYTTDEKGDYFSAKYNFENINVIQKLLEKTSQDIDFLLKGKKKYD